MKNTLATHQTPLEKDLFFVDFCKASPEAIHLILNALNAEVDEAVAQKRVPLLENAFRRLGPVNSVMN